MGRFDVDLAGNYAKGADLVMGLRSASKKQTEQDAYDESRRAAGEEIDRGLSDAQAAGQAREDSRASVNNAPGQQVQELLTPSQKPAAQPVGLSIVDQAVQGNQPVIDSQLPPKAAPTAAPLAPAGLSQAKQVAKPQVDEDLRRVKEHELTAKYLREKGQYDLANAELDKATAAHGKYLTNTQAQRVQLAGVGARHLEAGNIEGATDAFKKLTGMVHDGHEIQSLTQNKDGTFNVVYGADAKAKPVTVTKKQLIDLSKSFATPDINKHYEEVLKTEKFQSEINENNSTTGLNNAKAQNERDGKGENAKGYKVEMGEVSAALGTPAVDARGKPVSDPISGKQMVNRNPEEERKFFEWMQKSGIKDTNEALAAYLPTYNKKTGAPTAAPQGKRDWSKY